MTSRHYRRPGPGLAPGRTPTPSEASIRYTRIVQGACLFLTLTAGWLSHLFSVYLTQEQSEAPTVDVSSLVSSVWCHTGSSGEKLCKFRNICYDPWFQEFQFTMSEESIVFGIRNPEQWKDIDMSTVLDHNAFKMKVSIMSPENKIKQNRAQVLMDPTFIIHRFKPDNIMHVIHDELIPLLFTMESVSEKDFDGKQFSLAFTDDHNISTLDKWYDHFSKSPIIKLPYISETICFANAYVGMHKSTLWFDYGFKKYHGPYINRNFHVNGLKKFVKYSLSVWKSKPIFTCSLETQCVKVVVVSREQSRRILNLKTLYSAIEEAHQKSYKSYGLEIVTIDLARHDISFVLTELNQATLVVGMHGAAMILSLFMPPSSAIVELFPYAINPDNVSFLKALFQQREVYPLYYEFWRNKNIGDSRPGTHADPLMGKISHLSEELQNIIMSMTEVPPVQCCHSPAYLYYMYHDTYVQESVEQPILNALLRTQSHSPHPSLLSKHIFPASPSFLNCTFEGQELSVAWGESSNPEENENLWFQLTMLNDDIIKVVNATDSLSREFWMKLSTPIKSFQLWFQPFSGKDRSGHLTHQNCTKSR
ncbi:protein O-linked-mannose beta-1,4-N-acetylglucosaminyltransferase 2-like [Thrips palmi]|uniref:Protein O-linked-mannose beta-1,4-N-acetylglucosaminyltransferase 2-like n=1 Tax=Thrips palmi TaxID=161013 RepID=A0A6P8ZKH4_THRPL|nr:protein O-linked-mannose beta-1,4-N-acetylglucosaminyltransferase 2-like [Thrips palmi]